MPHVLQNEIFFEISLQYNYDCKQICTALILFTFIYILQNKVSCVCTSQPFTCPMCTWWQPRKEPMPCRGVTGDNVPKKDDLADPVPTSQVHSTVRVLLSAGLPGSLPRHISMVSDRWGSRWPRWWWWQVCQSEVNAVWRVSVKSRSRDVCSNSTLIQCYNYQRFRQKHNDGYLPLKDKKQKDKVIA